MAFFNCYCASLARGCLRALGVLKRQGFCLGFVLTTGKWRLFGGLFLTFLKLISLKQEKLATASPLLFFLPLPHADPTVGPLYLSLFCLKYPTKIHLKTVEERQEIEIERNES